MKKKNVLCVIGTILLLAGCGSRQSGMSYIGADKAKQLALNALALSADEAETVNADLTTYNGKDCYQVNISIGGQNYQYSIDAQTGVIVGSDFSAPLSFEPDSAAGGATGADVAEGKPAGGAAGADVAEGKPAGGDTGADVADGKPAGGGTGADSSGGKPVGGAAGAGTANGIITMEDAQAAALAHAGLAAEEVTFAKNELDYEDGRQVYELEFYTSDYREYDYEIDACTGEVVAFDYDAEHYVPHQSAEGGAITADEAKALALAEVPGAAADDIKEFEVEYDHGRTEYEGKIIYNGREYEFEIDGSNGQFLSWEEEPVFY